MERLKDLENFEDRVEAIEESKRMQVDGVNLRTDANEPKVVFEEGKFRVFEKNGKRITECTIVSYVKVTNSDLFMNDDRVRRDNTDPLSINLPFAYPTTKIVTTGYSRCDPSDVFYESLGKRVARIRAEKKAYRYHRKALSACVTRYIKYLENATKRFVEKSIRVETDPIHFD